MPQTLRPKPWNSNHGAPDPETQTLAFKPRTVPQTLRHKPWHPDFGALNPGTQTLMLWSLPKMYPGLTANPYTLIFLTANPNS